MNKNHKQSIRIGIMEKERILSELDNLIKEGNTKILPTKWYPEGVLGACYYVEGDLYAGWYMKVITFLKLFLTLDNEYVQRIIECKNNTLSNASISIEVLASLKECIEKGFISINESVSLNTDEEIGRLFRLFHRVARQLRSRYDNRPTISIEDEYDVQDLLHALLRLYFDDVRPEEWTPSYAGKSARMDFLLKEEKIVIEVKKTRKGLGDKELGDQLIIDVERYKIHPDCKKLICFIYDPEGRIGNPGGLVSDLNNIHPGFVNTIVEPMY